MDVKTLALTLVGASVLLCGACEPLLWAPSEPIRDPNLDCAPPLPPRDLNVEVFSDHVTLSWAAEDGAAADGFIVELRSFPEPTWGELGRFDGSPVDFDAESIPMLDAQHAFRVRAFVSAGGGCSSAPTDEVVVTTLPRSPEGAAASAYADRIQLSWRDPNDFETGYVVERRDRLIGGRFHALEGMPLARNTELFEDFLLLDGDWRYDYKIFAVNSSGRSAAALVSQPVFVSTRAARPPQASWRGDPYFDELCQLVLPTHADFDVELGAIYDHARSSASVGPSSTVIHIEEEPAGSGDFLIAAQLVDLVPNTLDAKWNVVDTLDGLASLERTVIVERSSMGLSRERLPSLRLGDDDMEGRQILLPGCAECSGRRGGVAAGAFHSCVVTDAGGVRCWGANSWGQGGKGISEAMGNPVRACAGGPTAPCASWLTGFDQVAVGYGFVCAIAGGGLKCWGESAAGQLGTGPDPEYWGTFYPQDVCAGGGGSDGPCAPLAGVSEVAAGYLFACALIDGEVRCWGDNGEDQLGLGLGTAVRTAATVCAGAPEAPCAAPLTSFAEVELGRGHTCARTEAGEVHCWGEGDSGELGRGGEDHGELPRPVCAQGSYASGDCTPLQGATDIAVGNNHACAVLGGGALKCWGDNNSGQVGDGTSGYDRDALNPRDVCVAGSEETGDCQPLADVAEVGAGDSFTCARTSGGEVYCWGYEYYGRLGNGASDEQLLAAPVCSAGTWNGTSCAGGASLTGVTSLAVGSRHVCALVSGGQLRCWGYNYWGQLGNGDDVNQDNPVTVCETGGGASCTPLTGVTAISSGYDHSCAVVAGVARCWGSNQWGELGDGGTLDWTPNPVDVCASGTDVSCVALSGAVAIGAGDYHGCATLAGGGVVCWGYNYKGALGDGSDLDALNPVDVCAPGSGCTPLSGIDQLSLGDEQTCALAQGGELLCWGNYKSGSTNVGNLAVGYADEVSNPTPVCASGGGVSCAPLDGATRLATGAEHACAVLNGGAVRCWGDNTNGQLGDGTEDPRIDPVDVCASGSGDGSSCSGSAFTGAMAVTAGDYHTCALVGSGVECWGHNYNNQLGDHSDLEGWNPVGVCDGLSSEGACIPLGGALAIVAGGEHTCALVDQGRVKCWGRNDSGQLGDGTDEARDGAVEVCLTGNRDDGDCSPLTGATAISTGDDHSCALLPGGEARCWGYNSGGQLGNGARSGYGRESFNPETVCRRGSVEVGDCEPLTGVSAIAAGGRNSCFEVQGAQGQELRCAGWNWDGELGVGAYNRSLYPEEVCAEGQATECVPLHGVISVVAGDAHTCAVLDDASAWCWGDGYYGQLGDGRCSEYETWDEHVQINPSPVLAAGRVGEAGEVPLAGVRSIAAGSTNTCAVLVGGRVRCWGLNDLGQVGDGTVGGELCGPDDTDVNTAPRAPVRLNPVDVCVAERGAGCPGLDGVLSVAIGGAHTCALTDAATVTCWGANDQGQLGDGNNESFLQLVKVCGRGWGSGCEPLDEVRSITAGSEHSCALRADGRVKCWGTNAMGELGDGTGLDATLPQTVCVSGAAGGCTPLEDLVAVEAAHSSTCAVDANGAVSCWGSNTCGQLGTGTGDDYECNAAEGETLYEFELAPVAVCGAGGAEACDETCAGTLDDAVAIAGGADHFCIISDSGGVRCWGYAATRALGMGVYWGGQIECAPVPVCSEGSERECGGGSELSSAARQSCQLITASAL